MKNREKEIKRKLKYYYENKERLNKISAKRLQEKYENDPIYMNKRKIRRKSHNIKITKPCNKCGSTKDLHRHHPDYNDAAFEVLCRSCHLKVHNNI